MMKISIETYTQRLLHLEISLRSIALFFSRTGRYMRDSKRKWPIKMTVARACSHMDKSIRICDIVIFLLMRIADLKRNRGALENKQNKKEHDTDQKPY